MSNETDKSTALETGEGSSASDSAAAEDHATSDASPEQIEQWRQQAAKAQEHWDRLVRVSADFDNYKKRAARERQDAVRYANESIMQRLIPVLDNFDMALAAASSAPANNTEAFRTGVDMIQSQLRSVLTDAGLEEIDATGKPFDPNWHEAVSQLPSTEVPEGHVLQQIRKGFKLNDRLIRPASVVVAKKPTG